MIEENESEIKRINSYLVRNDSEEIPKTDDKVELKIVSLKENLIQKRQKLTGLRSKVAEYEFELYDSQEFIESLENRATALAESSIIRSAFKELKIDHCPSCLEQLDPVPDDNHCELCRKPLEENKGLTSIKRMQQEIDNQLRESKKLYVTKEKEYLRLSSEYPTTEKEVKRLQFELDEALQNVRSKRDRDLESILIRKGTLISNNNHLIRQLKSIERLQVLRTELKALSNKIASLGFKIRAKRKEQSKKLKIAEQTIQKFALRLLKSDLGRQMEFQTARKLELNFEKNTFLLDGENNFSDSSNVYLKNSVRFAIFFASVELDFFRYPRMILSDNMEDKGMEPERSHSFQKEVVKISSELENRHQIIFTTSMIAPDLNGTEMCIGENYTQNSKTLKF